MLTADLHTHTKYSHAANSVDEMAMSAQNKHLKIFGFSEHSPRPQGYVYPSDYQAKLLDGYPKYIQEVQEMQKLCRASTADFTVLLGVEADFIPAEQDFVRQQTQSYAFDYIIGGLHFQDKWGFDASAEDWKKLAQDERFKIYTRYYEDLSALAESGIAHIIAHPDLIKMFSAHSFEEWLKTAPAKNIITHTLSLIKKHDLLMEVSSAGLRKPCRQIYPGPQIMQIASGLGLKICLSSDAHSTEQIAYAFDKLEAYAREFGYTESWIIDKNGQRPLVF
jgi:histidinol-phosphatase (PHP family)